MAIKKKEERKGILERLIPVTRNELESIEKRIDSLEKLIEQKNKVRKTKVAKITAPRCKGTGKDGKPCKGIAIKGSDYCKWHQQ